MILEKRFLGLVVEETGEDLKTAKVAVKFRAFCRIVEIIVEVSAHKVFVKMLVRS